MWLEAYIWSLIAVRSKAKHAIAGDFDIDGIGASLYCMDRDDMLDPPIFLFSRATVFDRIWTTGDTC